MRASLRHIAVPAVMRWWMNLRRNIFISADVTRTARKQKPMHARHTQNRCGSTCSKQRQNEALIIARILTARAQRCSRFPLLRSSSLWNTGPLTIIPPFVRVAIPHGQNQRQRWCWFGILCAFMRTDAARARSVRCGCPTFTGPYEASSAYIWPTSAEPEPSGGFRTSAVMRMRLSALINVITRALFKTEITSAYYFLNYF